MNQTNQQAHESITAFPYPQARLFLIEAVQRWLPSEQREFAERIVDLHLDPENFAMPIKVNKKELVDALSNNKDLDNLRNCITFEDTKDIPGIARVMIRTHLNRQGIGFVTRGAKSKTLTERVMGVFPVGMNPEEYLSWQALTARWLDFAETCRQNGVLDDDGNPLFDDDELSSLRIISQVGEHEYERIKSNPQIHNNWAKLFMGVYSGFKYLEKNYDLDANRIWLHIDEASRTPSGVYTLVKHASKCIHEFGSTLAGSFFADLGAAQFIKDDIHVIDSIAAFSGLSTNQVRGEFSFNVMHHSAQVHNVTPRAIDKVMYLAGSGVLYLFDFKLDKRQQAKEKSTFLNFLHGQNPGSVT